MANGVRLRWRSVDVAGDGSCFFRALFRAANRAGVLFRLISCLNSNEERRTQRTQNSMSEDCFVERMRLALSKMVSEFRDEGTILGFSRWIWDVAGSMTGTLEQRGARFAKELGFPIAYASLIPWALRKPDFVAAVRVAVAWHVSVQTNYVGPLEVELVRLFFRRCVDEKSRLLIYTDRDWHTRAAKRDFQLFATDLVLLNSNELHYRWVDFR